MTLSTPVPPSLILARAEAAFARSEHQCGARLAYQAALQAVAAAAARDNFSCETVQDAKAYLKSLDPALPDLDTLLNDFGAIIAYIEQPLRSNGDDQNALPSIELPPSPLHIEFFGVAESFQEHADTPMTVQAKNPERYWQPDEYVAYLSPVRELISMLASRARQGAANDQ